MNMKKKLFSVAALAMACTVALAGCSSKSNETSNEDSGKQQTAADGEGAAADNVLTVAMECGYAPYNWTQTRTEQFRLRTAPTMLTDMT